MANLYKETNDKNIKEELLKIINHQLNTGTINNCIYRELYKKLYKYINKTDADNNYIKCELLKRHIEL